MDGVGMESPQPTTEEMLPGASGDAGGGKDAIAPETPVLVETTEAKRPRGRPRKKTLEVTSEPAVKRPRGRPRKPENDSSTVSPEKGVKRGRGRPRKSIESTPGEKPPSDNESAVMTSWVLQSRDTVASAVAKKSPGRPRKAESSPRPQHAAISVSSTLGSQRKRGRPSKVHSLNSNGRAKKHTALNGLSDKRGRGRPKKSELPVVNLALLDSLDEDIEAIKMSTNDSISPPKGTSRAAPKSQTTPDSGAQKRGRGRPRKSLLATKISQPKRPRGRPRKEVKVTNDTSDSDQE